MRDWTVHLLRAHILQYTNRLRIYVSSLPDSEPGVYQKLSGTEGVKTAARIADRILAELGHPPPEMTPEGTSPTVRAARQALGNGKRG